MFINSLILTTHQSLNLCLKIRQPTFFTSRHILLVSTKFRSPHFFACSSSNNGSEPIVIQNDTFQFHTQVGTPKVPSFSSPVPKFSLSDQAFFLLAFIACTGLRKKNRRKKGPRKKKRADGGGDETASFSSPGTYMSCYEMLRLQGLIRPVTKCSMPPGFRYVPPQCHLCQLSIFRSV